MYFKKVLDLGCGQGDISGAIYRLGADVLALDARQEHLQVAGKKYPGLKTIKADLDRDWPFNANRKFDIILDLGLLCHVRDYEAHLRNVCASTTHLVLETAVCDSDDPDKCIVSTENKNIYDLSINGVSSRPSAAAIEKILLSCGMNFKRLDQSKFNAAGYTYDWEVKNTDNCDITRRRIWFAVKDSSPIQFAKPKPHPSTWMPQPPPQPAPIVNLTPLHSPKVLLDNAPGDKKFVIVIPSYKNEAWCIQNIASALNQNYGKFRVLFTDDCSPDGTFEKVKEYVNNSPNSNRCTLKRNNQRIGALANLYNMIHSCDDEEIILTLDGDDWFPHENVLTRLNQVYQQDVWITYGQYQNYPNKEIGVAAPYPQHIVNSGAFRHHNWGASHLRTFYAWLFKKIKKEDLMQNGQFFSMTWDFAIMFPMLEMARNNSRYLSDILYTYNLENPINDHKVNGGLQQSLDRYIRNLPMYQKTERPTTRKPRVGLILIATNKYTRYIQGMISSADKFFLKDICDVSYYILSDQVTPVSSYRPVNNIHIEHKPWPFATMDRFKHFTNNASAFEREDYLYYVDVDCLFVDTVGDEILGNLVGVRHCGYYNTSGPYENNPNSCLYVDGSYPKKYKFYAGGGFSGGKREEYLKLAKWCYDHIEQDVSRGITPVWQDESALNRYFLDHEPDVILSPSYHHPQGNIERYHTIWGTERFKAKLLLLDKNHAEIRS